MGADWEAERRPTAQATPIDTIAINVATVASIQGRNLRQMRPLSGVVGTPVASMGIVSDQDSGVTAMPAGRVGAALTGLSGRGGGGTVAASAEPRACEAEAAPRARNSVSNADAVRGRSSGSRAIMRRTRVTVSAGRLGRSSARSGGGSLPSATARSTVTAEPPE